MSPEDTAHWLRAWTSTDILDPSAFRVFGQDGTGGYAALWLAREGESITEQPVVFLGSERDMGVVASYLADFLWLLADGSGPLEAVDEPDRPSRPHLELTAVAERHASGARKSAIEVITLARERFPDLVPLIEPSIARTPPGMHPAGAGQELQTRAGAAARQSGRDASASRFSPARVEPGPSLSTCRCSQTQTEGAPP